MNVEDNRQETQDLAENIYQRFKAEEFDIDSDKAMKITLRVTRSKYEVNTGKAIREDIKGVQTLLIIFTNALTHYQSHRNVAGWHEASEELAAAYQAIRLHGCVIPGLAFKKDLREKEHRIVELDAELQNAKKILGDYERHIRDKDDELHNRDARIRTLEDILTRNHIGFGNAESGVY